MKRLIKILVVLILFIVLILLYSRFIGTKGIKVKEYTIKNKNITDEYYGLKIVHITDIHYGRITHEKELNKLVEKVNKTKPDIIVFTGDLIDKDYKITSEETDKISSILSKMNASIGKYAVNGEHDNISNWNLIIENANFIILNNSYDKIYLNNTKYILISGVDVKSIDLSKTDEILKSKDKPIYSILLIHKPDYIKNIDIKNYNLILAGHSHNGQIRLPFIGAVSLPKGSKKYYNPHYSIGDAELYISGGIGCSSYNFRLLNKPSFNLYRLVNK